MAREKKEKRRREKGTGSIEWLGPDKCRLIVSVTVNGKRERNYRTLKTTSKSEANKALREFTNEIEAGSYVRPSERKTFADLVQDWLELSVEGRLAPKSIFVHKNRLESWILPELGHYNYAEIKGIDLDRFFNKLKQAPRKDHRPGNLSSQTIKHIRSLLHNIFEFAVRKEMVQRNPVGLTERIVAERKPPRFYDEDEISKLMNALKKESIRNQALVRLTLATGCRLGEIAGLEWKHINLETGDVEIVQAGQYLPERGVFEKSPKNKSSVRTVSLPESVLTLLKFYKKNQEWQANDLGNLWEDSDRLFTNKKGGPINPNILSFWFVRFVKRNNLPDLNFHGLRHTAASYLLSQNEPIQDVADMLGHSTPKTTLDVYTHASKNAKKKVADKMEILLNRPTQQAAQ